MKYIGQHLGDLPEDGVAGGNQVLASFVANLELVEQHSSLIVRPNQLYTACLTISH